MKDYIYIALLLVVFIIGFFLGRGKARVVEKVSLKKGETVYGSLNPSFLTTPKEFKGDIQMLPYIFWKNDTIKVLDTVKVVEDFLIRRDYSFNVFNNDNGVLDITQSIQHNRLQTFDYKFTPIHKTITVKEKNIFEPYGSIGYNTFNQVSVGGGVFINNLGLEYSYIYDTRIMLTGHGLSVKLKF